MATTNRLFLGLLLVSSMTFAASSISARPAVKTPDGETPSVEDACDGLTGAAYGLCVAFCEAQDCHLQTELDASCAQLFDNYLRLTGEEPPCRSSACVPRPLGLTHDVSIDLNVDDTYCLFLDGLPIDCQTDWTVTGSYRFPLQSGCHVIAVEGADIFGLISALIAVVRVDGAIVSVTGDGSWLLPPLEPPPAGWRDVGFDDTGWTAPIACTNTSPWGGAPAPLLADGARWVWDEPAGDCFAGLGEVYFRLEVTLP